MQLHEPRHGAGRGEGQVQEEEGAQGGAGPALCPALSIHTPKNKLGLAYVCYVWLGYDRVKGKIEG